MSTAVAERESTGTNLVLGSDQTFFNEAQTAALMQMGLGDAPRGDIETFFHQAKRSGLDPFARQIYMIGRRTKVQGQWVTKYTIQTSIDGFRVIRDRKGTFRGMEEHWCGTDGVWRDVWLEKEPPAAARITLYLEGFVKPVTAVARYDEYVPLKDNRPTGQWGKMPALMTSKVAEALALRKAYPQDYSGLYTSDEMAQADNPGVARVPQSAPTPSVEEQPRPSGVSETQHESAPSASNEPEDAEVVDETPAPPAYDQDQWALRIQQCTTVDQLRTLWGEATAAGILGEPFGEEGHRLGDVLRGFKQKLETGR